MIRVKQCPDFLNGEACDLQVLDFHEGQRLLLLIKTVSGPGVHLRRFQQIHPVIVPQGLGIAAAQAGKILDGHIHFSKNIIDAKRAKKQHRP